MTVFWLYMLLRETCNLKLTLGTLSHPWYLTVVTLIPVALFLCIINCLSHVSFHHKPDSESISVQGSERFLVHLWPQLPACLGICLLPVATPANTQPTVPLVLAPPLLQSGFSSALDPEAPIKGSCTSSAVLHGGLGVLPSPAQLPEALEWRERKSFDLDLAHLTP